MTVSSWHVTVIHGKNIVLECLITLWLDCLLSGTGLVASAQQSRTNSSCYHSQLPCLRDRVSSESLCYFTFLEITLRNPQFLFWQVHGFSRCQQTKTYLQEEPKNTYMGQASSGCWWKATGFRLLVWYLYFSLVSFLGFAISVFDCSLNWE